MASKGIKSNSCGILLAGGLGSRLLPLTKVFSKQLLPIYNKPLVYYPLSTLMLSGVRDIAIITTTQDQNLFVNLLGDGTQFGIDITYLTQAAPRGIPEAFEIAEEFVSNRNSLLILGDNVFHGNGLGRHLENFSNRNGSTIFCYPVKNPSEFGIANIDKDGTLISMVEKPVKSSSNLAITGLYFFDSSVVGRVKKLKPSKRGELEIVDLLESYSADGALEVEVLPRGSAWLDTGTFEGLHDAASYVKTIEDRTGLSIGDPLDVARVRGWV
jgi:glucose-1-phosphate thymidylyltransferase